MNVSAGKIVIGGLVLYGLYELYKLRTIGNLVFYPTGLPRNMAFNSEDGVTPTMELQVLIQNTSSLPTTINSISGNLFANNTLVGNVAALAPVEVPAGGEVVTAVRVRFQILGLVNDIIRAFQSNSFGQQVQFKGVANVGGLQVPLSLTYQIGG